jgi:xylan 1,4-beta-xylosidase
VSGLVPGSTYTLTHERVDAEHSNIAGTWGTLRSEGQDWPDDEQWEQLRKADRLEELEPPHPVVADDEGTVEVSFELPMPGMSFLRVR